VKRPRTLRRRITSAFALTTLLLSLALSVPYGWTLRSTLEDEADALAREELEETVAHFDGRAPTPESFAAAVEDMRGQHPDYPLAWRVWADATGAMWGEFGDRTLLERAPRERPGPSDVRTLEGATRWTVGSLGSGLTTAVLVDASTQGARFRRFLLGALGFVLLATGLASLAGGLLAARVSSLLAQVARSARTEDTPETWLAPSEAPEEIQDVVRALQDTLRRIREETENARLVTSGLAHELRSPLQNLTGETQVALLREREPAEYRRVLESHLEELGELSRMVDNLVALSSVDEARRRRSVEHFDLAGEARLRLAREFQLAARRAVALELRSSGPLMVEGDREALLLALRNVVTNAIEWSPRGKAVEVSLGELDGTLEILVDDAGPGVAPEERELIFRPFHRGAAARGRRVGFGLGLALTHSAVRAQGGSIEVGDSPLGGARFRIRLPRRVD
jgi:signal transduction histidine kinase